MLNNLILDIGNVICDWNPDALIGAAFDSPAEQEEALRVTVGHADWLALDQGLLSMEEGIARAQARTGLNPDGIASIYQNLGASLLALSGTMDAMHRAKAAGVPIYILSNMPKHAWDYLAANHDCWDACEGVVVSCEAGCIKPDAEIYQHLCERFSVTPQSCVFVDDMEKNTAAAIAFGMQAEQLTDKHAGGELVDRLVARILADRA